MIKIQLDQKLQSHDLLEQAMANTSP